MNCYKNKNMSLRQILVGKTLHGFIVYDNKLLIQHDSLLFF